MCCRTRQRHAIGTRACNNGHAIVTHYGVQIPCTSGGTTVWSRRPQDSLWREARNTPPFAPPPRTLRSACFPLEPLAWGGRPRRARRAAAPLKMRARESTPSPAPDSAPDCTSPAQRGSGPEGPTARADTRVPLKCDGRMWRSPATRMQSARPRSSAAAERHAKRQAPTPSPMPAAASGRLPAHVLKADTGANVARTTASAMPGRMSPAYTCGTGTGERRHSSPPAPPTTYRAFEPGMCL